MLRFAVVWALVLSAAACSLIGYPAPEVNESHRREFVTQVSLAFADLDSLPGDYPGLTGTPASVSQCGYSDGDFFDEAAYKEWDFEPTSTFLDQNVVAETKTDITRRLVQRGWEVTQRGKFAELEKSFGDVDLTVRFVSEISPLLEVLPTGWDKKVCRPGLG